MVLAEEQLRARREEKEKKSNANSVRYVSKAPLLYLVHLTGIIQQSFLLALIFYTLSRLEPFNLPSSVPIRSSAPPLPVSQLHLSHSS